MATYNGHKNWNHWNVCLWLMGDEVLYRRVEQAISHLRTLDDTARDLAAQLKDQCTPDGAPYTFASIRAAIRNREKKHETE